MQGYRAYVSHAKEDFCGTAMLVANRLASYEVPHGLHWLIHVKVLNYARLKGPTHFINVYLKSGGNHRHTRREQLTMVKNIVAKILECDGDAKVVVLGDMNEPEKQIVCHLNTVRDKRNYLIPARFVGSRRTHFPLCREPSGIDNVLLSKASQRLFRACKVLRDYESSDHRPVVMCPYADLTVTERMPIPSRPAFDSKMIQLKGDLLVNDNAWTKLMQRACGECDVDGDSAPIADDEQRAEVSAKADEFIATFN
jgi:hypothetical protein